MTGVLDSQLPVLYLEIGLGNGKGASDIAYARVSYYNQWFGNAVPCLPEQA
jgi:hypothetical protein